MHSIFIEETNTTLSFPENATQLTASQLLAFCELLLQYKASTISFNEFKINAAKRILNIKRVANLQLPKNEQIAENMQAIANLLDDFFIINEPKSKNQLQMNFYMQLLPHVTISGKKYYGPANALTNTVYGEYLKLIHHFTQYSNTGNPQELDSMIATIYRPKKSFYTWYKNRTDFDGDIRRTYNEHHTAKYVKNIQKLPLATKYAIYLYVASSQHFIANSTNLQLGANGSIDISVLFKSTDTGTTANNIGMVGTLFSLAETNVFGTVKQVEKENTYDVLVFLAKQTHAYNQLKSKTNATN
ncbi:hypothetical protein EZY14_002680 [Kordia sp. TARA_039_SRF]|nr:hypothetical protein EZY14_002680 [Kordia sp. TARA_039_SRF]